MTKAEKINFNSLNGAFPEKSPRVFSEAELLAILRSPETLIKKGKTEQLQVVAAMIRQMEISQDFRNVVLEEIGKPRREP